MTPAALPLVCVGGEQPRLLVRLDRLPHQPLLHKPEVRMIPPSCCTAGYEHERDLNKLCARHNKICGKTDWKTNTWKTEKEMGARS